MRILIINLLLFIGCLTSANASNIVSSSTEPLYITSDNASFNRTTNINIYEGNVVVVQGLSTLTASKVITYGDKKNNMTLLIATGSPARFQTQKSKQTLPLHIQAQTIKYHLTEKYLNLIGTAFAEQDQDKIEGPELIYHLTEQTLSSPISNTNRTILTLYPKKRVYTHCP